MRCSCVTAVTTGFISFVWASLRCQKGVGMAHVVGRILEGRAVAWPRPGQPSWPEGPMGAPRWACWRPPRTRRRGGLVWTRQRVVQRRGWPRAVCRAARRSGGCGKPRWRQGLGPRGTVCSSGFLTFWTLWGSPSGQRTPSGSIWPGESRLGSRLLPLRRSSRLLGGSRRSGFLPQISFEIWFVGSKGWPRVLETPKTRSAWASYACCGPRS